jgi:hypothetical protein
MTWLTRRPRRWRRCRDCGAKLTQPRSIAVGSCLECRLIAESRFPNLDAAERGRA